MTRIEPDVSALTARLLDEYGDADTTTFLADRRDDPIPRGGVNIYSREIELVLHGHPAVVDCAVLGVPDDRYGAIVKAVVERRRPAIAEDLRAYCRGRLADFKCPQIVELVDALPHGPSGKIRKRAVRDAHVAAAPGGDGHHAPTVWRPDRDDGGCR